MRILGKLNTLAAPPEKIEDISQQGMWSEAPDSFGLPYSERKSGRGKDV